MRGAISPRRRAIEEEEAEAEERERERLAAAAQQQPVDVMEYVRHVGTFTAPDLSIFFLLFFAGVAYFHETHFAYTTIVVGAWLLLQVVLYVVKEDFRNDLFWSLLSFICYILGYLVVGWIWSLTKLYIDIWQRHLPVHTMNALAVCANITSNPPGLEVSESIACYMDVTNTLKWQLGQWMLSWPVSMAHTLAKDPLKIATDLAFEWSRKRYVSIIESALGNTGTVTGLIPWWSIPVGIAVYLLIGTIWASAKIFIDVWLRTLPPSIEAEAMRIWRLNREYFGFVMQIKWLFMQWILTWPISIIYTILRHPCRLFIDLVYSFSQRRLANIVYKAMSIREKAE